MEKKNSLEQYKKVSSDFKYSFTKAVKNGDEEHIFKMLDTYIDYVDAAVRHTVCEEDFKAGFGDRSNMGYLNGRRSDTHNDAIKETIAMCRSGLCSNLDVLKIVGDKTSHMQFNGYERAVIGDYIFQTVTAYNTLTEKELDRILGEKKKDNLEDKVHEEQDKIKGIERNFGVKITEDSSNIRNQIQRKKSGINQFR